MFDVQCSPPRFVNGHGLGALLLLVFLLAITAHGTEVEASVPPKLTISGYGLPGNLRLKQSVKLLEYQDQPPLFFDADFEDARLILASRMRDDGYLKPSVAVEIRLEDGTTVKHVWSGTDSESLPRTIRANRVHFRLEPGVHYHYRQILFTGLSVFDQEQARAYFVEAAGLLRLKRNRVFSPERLDRSVANLQTALHQRGYRDAKVSVARLERNDRTGAVIAEIEVIQGHKFVVRSARGEVYFDDASTPSEMRTNALAEVYSRRWAQDYALGIKTNYYRQGYPETAVNLRIVNSETTDEIKFLDLLAEVKTGPPVRVGMVGFEGASRTKISAIRKRVSLRTGLLLDRMEAERGRYRLSRLGGFDRVELDYEPVDTNTWNVTYSLTEGKRMDVSLLFGFGSYDLLRGGIELNQYDLWGRAHYSRLRLVQSFRSSSGDYTYTIPEPFGEGLDLFLNASALRREEVSFVRLEYGGGVGVRKRLVRIGADATLRYNYGILQATDTGSSFRTIGAEKPTVGEFILDLTHDRRDNPLNPQRGYRLSANLEWASPWLGGEVGFQRAELAASGHLPLGAGRWIHAGVRHGVAATLDRADDNLPFARRFFPGGENSVRGFKEGEASPRDQDGNIIGAETYVSGSVELEQAITPKWSLVGFVDGVGFARDLRDYPGNEKLFSAGGGVRWKTVIGPLRVEYGHNLNPRPKDPRGTWQFSLGCPF
jgi:outer membrane protein assembly complex protein YaeT